MVQVDNFNSVYQLKLLGQIISQPIFVTSWFVFPIGRFILKIGVRTRLWSKGEFRSNVCKPWVLDIVYWLICHLSCSYNFYLHLDVRLVPSCPTLYVEGFVGPYNFHVHHTWAWRLLSWVMCDLNSFKLNN